eukprot:RCo009466
MLRNRKRYLWLLSTAEGVAASAGLMLGDSQLAAFATHALPPASVSKALLVVSTIPPLAGSVFAWLSPEVRRCAGLTRKSLVVLCATSLSLLMFYAALFPPGGVTSLALVSVLASVLALLSGPAWLDWVPREFTVPGSRGSALGSRASVCALATIAAMAASAVLLHNGDGRSDTASLFARCFFSAGVFRAVSAVLLALTPESARNEFESSSDSFKPENRAAVN